MFFPFSLLKLEYNCFKMLCQFLLYSNINQLYAYTYPPSWTSLPPQPFTLPSQVITELFVLCSWFPLAIYFANGSIYMSTPISQFISPSPSLLCPHVCSLYLQLYPCKQVHQYNFSRFHVYALIYNICFSLSDLLHSV